MFRNCCFLHIEVDDNGLYRLELQKEVTRSDCDIVSVLRRAHLIVSNTMIIIDE